MRGIEVLNANMLNRIFAAILTSGVFVNAVHLYGVSYYQGLVSSLGFNLEIFPIDWSNGRVWAYEASREFGMNIFDSWMKFTGVKILFVMFVVYMLVRFGFSLVKLDSSTRSIRAARQRKALKLIARKKKTSPIFYAMCRWLFFTKEGFIALMVSYMMFFAILFFPFLICLWVFLPMAGHYQGEIIGNRMLGGIKASLCNEKGELWSSCVAFNTSHLKEQGFPDSVTGRLLFKNDKYVAIFTKDGPVTMTLPDAFYSLNMKNKNQL